MPRGCFAQVAWHGQQLKRKSLPPQWQQMNILRDAKDNDQFQ
jgi:hypothetical protein